MARRLKECARAGPWRRLLGLVMLVLAVWALHVIVMQRLADRLIDFGTAQLMPARIEVAYVRELAPAAPPATAPARALASIAGNAHGTRMAVVQPARPASAPESKQKPKPKPKPKPIVEPVAGLNAEPDPEPVAPPQPAEDRFIAAAEQVSTQPTQQTQHAPSSTEPDRAAEPDQAASPARPASAPAPAAAPFVWPASTRISYTLTGNYRGEVKGDAQVEWVHVGSRYQVHLDLTVGPSFAPLISRRMSSDGELTPEGLAPARYDQQTQLMLRDPQRAILLFGPDAIVLADGQRRDRWPGVQDTASQFVQLTYLFTTRPELLRVGGSIELPLALPRKLDRWIYDVLDEEVLQTSFGPLATFHLKPRRVAHKGGDLVAEIWFAPQLRYLPVRIRISQDAETYIDLLIARKPELAAS